MGWFFKIFSLKPTDGRLADIYCSKVIDLVCEIIWIYLLFNKPNSPIV